MTGDKCTSLQIQVKKVVNSDKKLYKKRMVQVELFQNVELSLIVNLAKVSLIKLFKNVELSLMA